VDSSNLENWIFGNNASSEDVSDGNSVKSVHGNVATPVGETDTEPKLKNLLVKQKNLVPNSRPVSSKAGHRTGFDHFIAVKSGDHTRDASFKFCFGKWKQLKP
jgi:hypothetical protein